MSQYQFLITIALALGLGAMSPGPSFLVVASNSLRHGIWGGVLTSIGTGLGAAIYAFLAMVGISILVEQYPILYRIIRIIGVVFLLYIAFKVAKHAKEPLNVAANTTKMRSRNLIAHGLLIQLSNPKTVLVIGSIFAALVPQVLPPYSVIAATLIAFFVDFFWYALVSLGMSHPVINGVYERYKVKVDTLVVLLLVLLALKMALELANG